MAGDYTMTPGHLAALAQAQQPMDEAVRTPDAAPDAFNNTRDVNIGKVENGFIVHVGCKTFVFTDIGSLIVAVNMYYTDPKAAYRIYLNKKDKE